MPFKRLQSREVYRNKWLGIKVYDVVHPAGVKGEHVLIDTPPCSVVLVDDDGDLLFTRQERFAVEADMVEIVKGGAEPSESALDCAKRELREELGIVARHWEELGVLFEIPSIVSEPLTLFLARDIEHVDTDQEDVEQIELVRVPSDQAIMAAATGKINDAVTVAALLRYEYAMRGRAERS